MGQKFFFKQFCVFAQTDTYHSQKIVEEFDEVIRPI
jgi:hypothetical protein